MKTSWILSNHHGFSVNGYFVIPAKAGIQSDLVFLDSRVRGNDK